MATSKQSPISFRIKRSPRTKQLRCIVRNEGNHEITLTGEPCKNEKDVRSMIEAHISAVLEGRYSIIVEGEVAPAKNPAKKPKGYAGKLNRNWP